MSKGENKGCSLVERLLTKEFAIPGSICGSEVMTLYIKPLSFDLKVKSSVLDSTSLSRSSVVSERQLRLYLVIVLGKYFWLLS